MAIGMGEDAAAQVVRQHLRAQADAEERLVLPQRHRQPVDLAADEIVGVVGAHRAAEDDGGGMIGQLSGNGSPKRGRRMSSGNPRILSA